ncbi:GLPGLI family protein [Mucilaginibacter robiniae]|uniref:GLPGLI family protein n=1 Tax=Mucilaginibacter robiniae TaxID=2728022 RepID=A0A7L5E3A9_9SPHI|nr:GLPGLI family protein [Mucilaginibacter robiniae]QJD97521.1 GLPGLI family protein [Mucilaginibacter robiniae]
MKTRNYLIIFLQLACVVVKAQKPDTAQAIVHYKFSHLQDTTHRDQPYTENMMLLIGRNASLYKSYDKILRDEQMRKSMAEQINSGTTNFNIKSTIRASNTEYFQFFTEKKFLVKENLFNNYLIEEPVPEMQWKITADTASFNGLQCQKATTHFKGRDYIAWFCADLPYRAGPWKLSGLPGLIIEAYDTKKEVVFKFDGLEKVDASAMTTPAETNAGLSTSDRTLMISGMDNKKNSKIITLPTNGIRTTRKEFAGLQEIMRKDPQAFIQSQVAAMRSSTGGTSISAASASSGPNIKSINVVTSPSRQTTVVNNPIELPEKK